MTTPFDTIHAHAHAVQMLEKHGIGVAFEINKIIDGCRARDDRHGADFWHKVYAVCHRVAHTA